MPIKLRFKFLAATPVDPDPIQLSRTFSPSVVYVFIRYSNNATGFCVECNFSLSLEKNNVFLGYLVPVFSVTILFISLLTVEALFFCFPDLVI